ncbi:DMT family transporter [Burkholderiaceae bacterium FT117]|uniref:DMT family transporter n=1 Tax=Zeimonas sediminis TaxID=2944268 RepID=UPI002342E026|nr:DMT family transporter [Zeimonas sediminis]MCM5570631.1 DMT family transporter [Zeimonas sediminis]
MPPDSPSTRRLQGYALLFSGMALVGTYVALSKPLTGAFPVFLLAWLRFAIAAAAMLPWLRRRPGEAPLDGRLLGTIFVQSLFGNFLFSILMLTGVSMTSAAAAGVILAMLPAAVALLSWLVLRERLGPRTWTAVALAVGGVVVLTLGRSSGGGAHSVVGNLLVLGCVFCEAVYVILGKRLTASLSAKRISALLNLWGLALMTPLGLWQAAGFDFGAVGARVWSLLLFYALAASMFSTWLWLSGLRHVPANHSGVFTIAMPLAASAVAATFLGESLGPAHAVAFACAAGGILLIAVPARAASASTRNGPDI